MKLWAAGLLLLGAAWAASAEVKPPADVSAAPGEYATLLFSVWGSGEVHLAALVPEGWQALPLPDRVQLEERTFVALTVRVPELTPADSRHPLVLQAWEGDRLLSQATAHVTVEARADLIVYLEDKHEARMGAPFTYRVTVINRGNRRDRIVLEAAANTGEAFVTPTVLELDPGEEGWAKLTLQIGEGRSVSPGYTMITWVRARSTNGGFVRKVRASTRWVDPLALDGRGPDPTLRLGLSGSLGVGGRVEAGELAPLVFRYSVQPVLSGQLSDYVEGQAQPAAVQGGSPNWWPRAPGSVSARLKGPAWDASLAATGVELGLQTGFKLASWRYNLGARGRYDATTVGFSVGAASTRKDLNLQWNADTRVFQGRRQDRFSVGYSLPITENLNLRLGGRLSGIAAGSYTVVGSAQQGVLWQSRRFSVLESLTVTPQLDLYALTVTGGTRSVYPLGVRGTTHLQSEPAGLAWKVSTSLFATPLPRTSLRLTTAAEAPAAKPLEFSLNPSLGVNLPNLSGLHSRFGLGYKLRYRPQDGELVQVGNASMQLRLGRFSLSGNGFYTLTGPPAYSAKLGLSWRPLPLTVLRSEYSLRQGSEYQETLGLSWQQYWGSGFATQLDFRRAAGVKTGDRLGLYLAQQSLLGSPFGLVLGYAVSDADGLGRGRTELTQTFSVQLGFNFAWQFTTPEPVVAVFGGRRVGEVRGVAFIDRNHNGVKDEGEPAVAGLGVGLGGASTVTDADGSFRLLARPGRHRPRLTQLPATLDLYQELDVEVKESQRYVLDLPLAPTAQLALVLFHDANHNGRQDAEEFGIPYGGVRLSGPTQRSFRTDERGLVLATGLLPGTYRVEPDPEFLPPRFRATATATVIELEPGKADRTLALGAAPPPKEVRTTYDASQLAVFASLPSPIAAAGGEVEVRAIAAGEPDQVWLQIEGADYPLEPLGDGRYAGRFRLPRTTPTGPQTLTVVAARGSETARGAVVLTVVERPLYTLDPVKITVGEAHALSLKLLFHARQVRLKIGEEVLEMTSEDGYRWRARWTARQAGEVAVQPVADGEELAPSKLLVLPGRSEAQQRRDP